VSTKQQSGILKSLSNGYGANDVFGDLYCVLVDYKTGKVLEKKNTYKVTKKILSYKETKTKVFKTSKARFRTQKTCTAKISVKYPTSYKRLCVGIGGSSYPRNKENAAQKSLSKGTVNSFYNTSMYRKDKKLFHFIRIV
jgi:hypothetical protein